MVDNTVAPLHTKGEISWQDRKPEELAISLDKNLSYGLNVTPKAVCYWLGCQLMALLGCSRTSRKKVTGGLLL